MKRILALSACTLLVSAALPAATINTTLTVTNAIGALSGANVTITGPATLTSIGNGTFSGTISPTLDSSGKLSGTFSIALSSGGSITGKLSVPASGLVGNFTGVSATITGGTGTYANATGSFPSLSGSALLSPTGDFTFSFSGPGTINTGGSGGGPGPAAPTISNIENNYGQIAPGLPNYGLAPGTLFFVQGTNLANTTTDLLSSASPGLQTTVSGVSVSATVGGTTVQCPLYYLSPTQIDAVLPSTIPAGTGTLTVNNNGTTSTAANILVVQSAFGILSYNGTLAAAYDANNALITSTNAANPNQAIVLWGSGIGGDPSNDDKLYPQKQNNLTNIPVTAYVGGVQADIAYRGRSQFPGLDQVVLTVPPNAPTGCYVSLLIVSGNIVSNSVTIPVAASGKTCSDSAGAVPPEILQGLSGKNTVREGILAVSQTTSISASSTDTTNTVAGFFQSVSGLTGSAAANQVSLGSCLVFYPTSATGIPATTTGLDAGVSISATGPGGSVNLSQLSVPGLGAGFYAPASGTAPSGFIPSGGGTFTFDNGSGGKDVQHFNASIAMAPVLNWTNASQVSAVSRSQGVTVTWTGGASGSYVEITGSSAARLSGGSVSVTFACQAPVSAGQFTVPAPVLLALPAGSGSLSVGDYSNFQSFTAGGLDLGLVSASSSTSKQLNYN